MSIPSSSVTAQDLSNVLRVADLSASNTLGLSCRASHVFDLQDLAQLPLVSELARQFGAPLVLGSGSNLILPAELSRPVVRVGLTGIKLVEATPQAWLIDVAGGESWHGWVAHALAQGWEGLENLALIPGTVGASPVQNIGAYGVELDSRIHSVTAWHIPTAQMHTFSRAECGFSYRDSRFKRDGLGVWLIVSVRFALPRPWQPVMTYPDLAGHSVLSQLDSQTVSAQQIFDAVCEIRQQKLPDPNVLGNAGSFFKNPVVTAELQQRLKQQFPMLVSYPQQDGRFKLAAGWLIDQCGWKGRRLGAVGVHDRQALVLVNHGGAQAKDILELANAINQSVEQRFGVTLEIEPVIVPT